MLLARGASLALFLLCAGVALAGRVEAQAAVPGNRPASARALLDAQPKEVVEELMEERLVLLKTDPTRKGLVEALVLFTQPPERVFQLLTQGDRQTEYRPDLNELLLVERMDDGWIDEQHMKILFIDVVYRLRWKRDDGATTLTWELDPRFDNSLEHVSGYWELHALDGGRTLGRFGTRVRVGPLLPAMLQDRATRKNVPETLENTRAWVDSDGRWRP